MTDSGGKTGSDLTIIKTAAVDKHVTSVEAQFGFTHIIIRRRKNRILGYMFTFTSLRTKGPVQPNYTKKNKHTVFHY